MSTLRIEVGGVQYDSFVEGSVEIRLDSLASSFSFDTSSKDAKPLPFLGGEACEVFADGECVLTGFIEKVAGSGNPESHVISISGRDKPADIIDSTLDSKAPNGEVFSDLRPPITLKTVIERTIASLGAAPGQAGSAEISVVDEVIPDPFNEAEDLISPEPGDNAFEFIEKWARKRQVFLTSNGDGDVVIARGSETQIDAFLIHRVNSDDNNVISWSVDYDLTTRFNRYKMPSQRNLIALILAGITDFSTIVEQGGGENEVKDEDIRKGRQMIIVPETNSSDSESRKRAEWERNIRKARSRIYSAVVDGYRNQTGELWRVNQLVRVEDVFAGINSVMLVNSVIYGLTEDEGSTTSLSLVNRDAYTLEIAEPSEDDELGIGFIKALTS